MTAAAGARVQPVPAAAPTELHVLCAGAVKGLVLAVRTEFESSTGARLQARFGPVGAIRDDLAAGAACDVFVASEAVVSALVAARALDGESVVAIGSVPTAIAVRANEPPPAIGDAASVKASLLAASTIFVPDVARSTAGAHVLAVLERLGIRDEVATRLSIHASGADAMAALAEHQGAGALGCTQATEIRYTPNLTLVGSLPEPLALATLYSGAVASTARQAAAARALLAVLAGPGSATLRAAGGFATSPAR